MDKKQDEETIKLEVEVPKENLKVEKSKQKPKEEKEESDSPELSYKPQEIIKAVVEPPEPESKKGPNDNQKRLMFVGLSLILVSLIAWAVFNFVAAIAIALTGATLIAFGALVRV